ncbi:uncharacterized protein LOC135394788 isoform X1 [Ornithodoros turicata]|uniref:uncharacterized protein LOC135394788 isoform X1 n=1 Tax=Ornithodoros turicata TaxID=34597 RepID=UPI003139BA4A
MMRGDVLPPKRQAVVDRLRRRIELYRRHHNATLPRYEAAANAIYEEQHQDTLMLKQRYLESKTKKAKKNEHKTVKDNSSNAGSSNAADAQKNLLGKFNKPTPSENMEPPLESSTGDVGHLDKDQRSCKASRSCTSTPEQQQQLQESGNMQSQQLQSIPSFDCIKSGMLQPGKQTRHSSSTPKSPANISMGNIKLENDVDATLCGGNTNGVPGSRSQDCGVSSKQAETTSSTGEQFPDSFPNLGFPEDTSEVWVDNPEILRHLIDDITNPSDLMTDFNFSYGVETLKEGSNEKDRNGAIMGQGEKKSQEVSQSFGQSNPFPSHSQTSGSGFESRIPNPVDVMTRTTGGLSPNFPGNMQSPGQYPSPDLSGLEFKLSEPSLAAQTLKQMAEQHQQHKNSRAKHTMSMPPLKRSFADTYETNVGPMRASVFDPASNQMPKPLSTSSVTYNSMNYATQSAIQSPFHIDSSSKQPMNMMGTQGFNKLEANMYGAGREQQQQQCQTKKPLMRMPSTELQVVCATKMGPYSSSAEEKAAFFSNFKASLAQFNETSASPPLTKSPSQFNKRMTPSPLSQQGQMMVGHRQVQGNQNSLRPQKDHKEIAPLNISSNPSYAEALAFSSTVHTPATSHFQHHSMQHKAQQSKTVSFPYNELQPRPVTSTALMSDAQQHPRNAQNRPPMTITSQPFQNFAKINVGPVQRHPRNIMHSISPAGMQQTQQPFVSQAHVSSSTKGNIVSFVSQPSPTGQFATNQTNFSLPNIATIRSSMLHATSASAMSHGNQMFPQHKLLYTSAAPRPQRLPVNVEWRQTTVQQSCYQQQQRPQGARMNQQFTQQPVQRVQVPQQRAQFQASTLQSMSQPLPQLQIPQRTVVQSGGTFSPSLTSNISDFSLEFLDSIENSDSDLLNFDPVNSNFGILEDVLGGK